ncbi:MAG TPA: adenosine deaminase [Patescibacteria group bacterium]|nr:adenosine deaminase [Patescibacteria group bacterium]
MTTFPRTELHQHVDGSIPVDLTWRLMVEHKLNPVATLPEMEKLLVLQPDEEGSLLKYLDKFHYPLWITQFYENLVEVTQAIVEQAAANQVTLLELRYSPIIHTYAGLTLRQAIRSVLTGLNRGAAGKDMQVGLIIIAMRHHGPHVAKILARQAISESQAFHHNSGVIGFDIAGAEKGNPPRLFAEAYDIARRGGLGLTAHAGEDEGPEMVWHAVDGLGVNRVGHGCSAVRDKELMRRLARDRILVECCLTSNYQTGASSRAQRPAIFSFLEAGVPVAICTDNTTVSNTDQQRENELLARDLPIETIQRIHEQARGHSFIRQPAS